ncbi:hypothetical protein ACOSQ4_018740 [Xanthoceras sorbifolium]
MPSCKDLGCVGLGFIIHDSLGFPLAAGAIRLRASFDPQSAEATILHGIGFARDCGLAPVHVESDSLNVINFLHDRITNKVVDALTKATLDLTFDSFWTESCSPFVADLVQDIRPD